MRHVLTWLALLAIVAAAMSAELPLLKNKEGAEGDLKTASSFIGPFGYGYGWGYPYFGKGFGWGWGGFGWGYPYWG